VSENEPNDNPAVADAVSLGDQGTGEVNPTGDVDYWVFSATAGTVLDIDVDASQFGSPLDPTLELFAPDGVTSLAFNDDYDGLDSRIRYTISTTGSYYIAIRAFGGGGGTGEFYTINFNTITPGPGDPTTLFAAGLDGPGGIAVDAQGDLFVAELSSNEISRVTAGGTVSVFATGIPGPRGLAFDGFGDLLVASDDGSVYKVSAAGVPTPFLTGLSWPFWLATGPDGSIWVCDLGAGMILHHDAFGQLQDSFDVTSVGGAGFIAFSPGGELHFSNFLAIYKLVGGQPELVFTAPEFLEGFAFDVHGNLYVANEMRSRVILYADDGTVLEDPFALGVEGPVAVAFGRDADGATNARLFATDFAAGEVREMNPAGIRAPGWPVTVELLVVGPDALPDAVMGADYNVALTVSDQTITPTWSVVSGTLPPGISLDSGTGVLGGFPTEAGTFAFRVRAEGNSRLGEKDYSITVTEPVLAVTDVADQVLGVTGVLTAEEMRYLDLLGNDNGVFDVGDFRAFLLATGALAGTALADWVLLDSKTDVSGRDSRKGAQ
jgi:hypothetical protein